MNPKLVQLCPSTIKHNMPKMHENKLSLILISSSSFCVVNFFPFKILIKIECWMIRNSVMTLLKKFKLCPIVVGNGVCVMFLSYISVFLLMPWNHHCSYWLVVHGLMNTMYIATTLLPIYQYSGVNSLIATPNNRTAFMTKS